MKTSRKNWVRILVYILVITVLSVSAVLALFLEHKTFWDLMELLIVPVTLAGIGLWYSDHRATIDHEIESERQQDASLQAYFEQITRLLLDRELRKSESLSEVQQVARVRTLSVLRNLDGNRKSMVLQFLHEASLITKINTSGNSDSSEIISLRGADLRNAYLPESNLYQVRLGYVDLSKANLKKAWLLQAWLENANLIEANLTNADLSESDLRAAVLTRSTLIGAKFINSNLNSAILANADLREANLTGADLTNVTLTGANMNKANLTNAQVDTKQLNMAKSLKDTIMPDGTKYQR